MLLPISIHAPVKGATFIVIIPPIRRGDFNPRTREGCDAILSPRYVCNDSISIHAPVKGATVLGHAQAQRHIYFNPRTREGCDVPWPFP